MDDLERIIFLTISGVFIGGLALNSYRAYRTPVQIQEGIVKNTNTVYLSDGEGGIDGKYYDVYLEGHSEPFSTKAVFKPKENPTSHINIGDSVCIHYKRTGFFYKNNNVVKIEKS
jgi:hypothetical protein